MATPSAQGVFQEIAKITAFLVEVGLADDSNNPVQSQSDKDKREITFLNALLNSAMLKSVPYEELYEAQIGARSYNVKMLDGALIQMSYSFRKRVLESGRLAFLPSPDLSEYQNSPDAYLQDELFAEVVDRRVVTVPMRFDFDTDPDVVKDLHHPKSHLTLGQYKNCRIAASSAITPGSFVEFVLRSFYNTGSRKHSEHLPQFAHRFSSTITNNESSLIHIATP